MSEKISVLLIEDDLNDVEMVRRAFLTMYPPIFELTHVGRFLEAMQAVRSGSFKVILADLGLPDSSGLNGIERLMGVVPDVPVIVLTGSDDDETALRAIEMGAQEFLDKGDVTTKQLVRTIRLAAKRKQHALNVTSKKEKASATKKLADLCRDVASVVVDQSARLRATSLTEEQTSCVDRLDKKARQSQKTLRELTGASEEAPSVDFNPVD